MRRRDFIASFGAAAGLLMRSSRAHSQTLPVPTVAFLRSTAAEDSIFVVREFRAGLKEAGFVEGQHVAVEYHYADNDLSRLAAIAEDLIRRGMAAIVTNFEATHAIKKLSTSVPVVFAFGGDPVQEGFVMSLNRPGGNFTGVTFLNSRLGGKRLEILHQLVPHADTLAVLVGRTTSNTQLERAEVEGAARTIGRRLIIREAQIASDIQAAFEAFALAGAGGLLVGTGAFLNSQRRHIVSLAAKHRLPACYNTLEFVHDGGLMSYGPGSAAAYRQVGLYVGRILNGQKPADLPVVQSDKFVFALNLKVARELNVNVPQSLLVAADEVIE